MNLLPQVKKMELLGGYAASKSVRPFTGEIDARIIKALAKLPTSADGLTLSFGVANGDGEGYTLKIDEKTVQITADGARGAFYAVMTLRQILTKGEVPCLVIEDRPDFKYRGVYHDVTRGKVPKLETLKQLVDTLAYYKINSLQLYVEHTYEFRECAPLLQSRGYLTAKELRELDLYCRENFIDFIPSVATFGHMYEILELPEYRHLRVFPDYVSSSNKWLERMSQHTVNPLTEGSFELVSSLIDQYAPNFTSEYFNICGDETFDLKKLSEKTGGKIDEGRVYVDFIKKIIAHLKSKDKRVMMWGDILLRHPEVIEELPSDTVFLNWDYAKEPNEKNIEKFAKLGRAQIVCPGTSTWNKMSENVEVSEGNISKMAEYGYKHGALGLLNTNWGDWGNACSLELSLFGLALGAEKAWNPTLEVGEDYYRRASEVIYGDRDGVAVIKEIDKLYTPGGWTSLLDAYCKLSAGEERREFEVSAEELSRVQDGYRALTERISSSKIYPEIKEEMLTAVLGMCVMTEILAALGNPDIKRVTDTALWCEKFSALWRKKNKESELTRITDAFKFIDTYKA